MILSPVNITPYSAHGMGLFIRQTGGAAMNAAVSTAFSGTANDVLAYPVYLDYKFIARKAFAYLGATLAGNFAIGICSEDGQVLAATASTAQSGGTANTIMTVEITDTVLAPGSYALLLGCDSTSATFFSNALTLSNRIKPAGVWKMASGYATLTGLGQLTPATPTATYAPVFGLSQMTVI